MKKIINGCINCPLFHTEYDEYSVHKKDYTHICVLSSNLKNEEYVIDDEELNDYKTTKWCPLKEQEFTFKFKEFTTEELEKIKSIESEIHILINENDSDDIDYDSPEYLEKNDKLTKLYDEFDDLLKNDEILEDDIDINKSLDEFKSQMSEIENMSSKLINTLNNLDELE